MLAPLIDWLRRRWYVLAFVVAYVWSFPWFPALHSANELPRAYLTVAIVDDGTFAIDRQLKEWGKSSDVATAHRHQYSNKAPGSSLLAIPGYLALKGWHAIAGGEPSVAEVIWVSRLTTGMIPALLFLWLAWGFLGRFAASEPARRVVLVGFGLGSMFFLYSTLLISHPLAAIAAASAWIFAVDAVERTGVARLRRLALVGFLAGCAPLVDYQAAFATVPVAIWVIVVIARQRPSAAEWGRVLGSALAGAAAPIAVLLLYHAACFGGPLRTGYEFSELYKQNHSRGFLGLDAFRLEALAGSTFAPDNGLFVLWPMALLAIPGWALMYRRPEQRGHATVSLSVAVLYLAFVSSLYFWRGGWQVGPRYATAMLPFLLPPIVVAVAAAERTWWLRGGALGLCLVGLVTYGLTAALYPYFPADDRHGPIGFVNPIYELTLRLFVEGRVPWNAGWIVGLRGVPSLLPALACVAALVVWAAVPTRAAWRSAVLGVVVAAGIVAGYGLFGDGGCEGERVYWNRVREMPEVDPRVIPIVRCPAR